MDTPQETKVYINGKRWSVDPKKVPELTYEQIIQIAQMPMGTSVIVIPTHVKDPKATLDMKYEGRCQILGPKDKVKIVHGLNISAMLVGEEQAA